MSEQHLWKFFEYRQPAVIVWADKPSHVVFEVRRHSHDDARATVDWHNRVATLSQAEKPSS